MIALISSFVLLFAETASNAGVWAKVKNFESEWLNVPGFEAWKFINLAIFIFILVRFLNKLGLSDAFKAKRDAIRSELIKAEQDKQNALAKLTSAEGRLAQLENEKADILAKAKDEAAFEKKRLAEQAKLEAKRLLDQANSELARLAAQSNAELRRYSADKSVTLAEEKLRKQIDGKTDGNLVAQGLSEIGGLN